MWSLLVLVWNSAVLCTVFKKTINNVPVRSECGVLQPLHVDLADLPGVEVRVKDGTPGDRLAVNAALDTACCGRRHLHDVLVVQLRRQLREQRLRRRLAYTQNGRRRLPAADAGAAAHLMQRQWKHTRAAARGA